MGIVYVGQRADGIGGSLLVKPLTERFGFRAALMMLAAIGADLLAGGDFVPARQAVRTWANFRMAIRARSAEAAAGVAFVSANCWGATHSGCC